MGAQISPRPWLAMKATISLVTRLPAQMRSASFSRVGSSAQIMILPAAMSAIISSTGLKVSALMLVKLPLVSIDQKESDFYRIRGHNVLTGLVIGTLNYLKPIFIS